MRIDGLRRQHLAQHAHGEQGLLGFGGGRIASAPAGHGAAAAEARCCQVRSHAVAVPGAVGTALLAGRIAAALLAVARHARPHGHGIAHGLHPLLAQGLGSALVLLGEQAPQRVAQVAHPHLTNRAGYTRLAHHLLQRADVVVRAQRVALGLHAAQTLGRADQGVEFAQRGVGGVHRQLLGARKLHLRLHLRIVHQRELTEIHARGRRRHRLGGGRPLGEDFQQGHGIGLDQRGRMFTQQAQGIGQFRALVHVACGCLVCRQRCRRGLEQLLHERFPSANGIDDACAENRSGAGR